MEPGLPSRIFARTILFLRVLVIAALGVAAWASAHYLPGVSSQVQLSARGLLPSNSRASRTEAEASRLFGSSLLPRIAYVPYRRRRYHGARNG